MVENPPDRGVQVDRGIECRICRSGTSRDVMLSPCLCKGSLGHVHEKCLERWLNQGGRDSCELCGHRFRVVMRRRYSCLASARVWLRRRERRAFLACDLSIAAVLTTLTLTLVGLSLASLSRIRQIDSEMEENRGPDNVPPRGSSWAEVTVNLFLVILLAGYFATIYSMAMDHVRPWRAWWRGCVDVRLVVDNPPSAVRKDSETGRSADDADTLRGLTGEKFETVV